jgi:hypothetical protein
MLRKIFLLLLSFTLSSSVFAGSPATTTKDGLNFEIASASINTIGREKYLVIEFRFNNQTGTRKIDLDTGFQYALADNFNNRYRPLPKPRDYTKQLEHLPANFPSVYPGESCSTTLFFEAPVSQAATLQLLVTAPSMGITNPLPVSFSITPINPAATVADQSAPWVKITSPESGAVVERGVVFPLEIKLAPEHLPKKLIVIAFGQTFEDKTPTENNTYNIAVPENTPFGQASINVIGRWGNPPDDQVASKDIVVYVKGEPTLTLL